MTGRPLRDLLSGYTSVHPGRTTELDEFTRAEKSALVRAAWASVIELEQRLERGRLLLKQAPEHPVSLGWQDPANLLLMLHHGADPREVGDLLPRARLWPARLSDIFPASLRSGNPRLSLVSFLVSMLYPRPIDLQAFRVLLAASTGYIDEIIPLTEDDVEFAGSEVVLRLRKMRGHAERQRRLSGHGPLNTVEVLQRLMAVTEPARIHSGTSPAALLTCALVRQNYALVFGAGELIGERYGNFPRWARERGVELAGRVDIRRIRKAAKVEKVIARRGSIKEAADDHTVKTFLGHYTGGTTLRVLAGQIVVEAQNEWLERAVAAPRILDQATVDRLDDPQVQANLGLSPEAAEQLRDGALNMGISDCRDPYDAPHGRAGELCAVAPLHCLECGNALILPSSLPQLLLMADHIEQMRQRIAPPLFTAVWAQRRANLRAALNERTPGEIDQARSRIAQEGLRLQLPLASYTEFDL